jgi:hypothetical protein
MGFMNDAQTWTVIGVISTALFSMIGIVSILFVRILRAEIGSVRFELGGEIRGLRGEMNARFEAVDSKFDAVNSRFDSVNTRIDGIDRDVQALVKRTFGLDRE